MENQKKESNSRSRIIILLLLLLLLGSLGYIFKLSTDSELVKTQIKTIIVEKESVMNNLKELKLTYDAVIAENSTMSEELIKERDKVVTLIETVKKCKGDTAAMAKYKDQFVELQKKMVSLLSQNNILKKDNENLTVQRDSTNVILEDTKKNNQVLSTKNDELTKTLEKAGKLAVVNPKIAAFNVRNSGRQIETDKARRTEILKVTFTIAENKAAKPGNKMYYIQIVDSKNNVLGEKKTENFGSKSLTYSFISNVNYVNETVDVVADLSEKKFNSGTYLVNIYDKDQLVAKTSFSLE